MRVKTVALVKQIFLEWQKPWRNRGHEFNIRLQNQKRLYCAFAAPSSFTAESSDWSEQQRQSMFVVTVIFILIEARMMAGSLQPCLRSIGLRSCDALRTPRDIQSLERRRQAEGNGVASRDRGPAKCTVRLHSHLRRHIARFAKNLSPEQINLSTLRGEGQLTDLELDEEALQNMLDLPTWLAITRVYCNRAAIRIQWTKLKTNPICLMLDKVEIEMKTCEDPRPPNGPSPIALAAGQSEYGFAEKVVEGMFLEIGCVSIKIQSHTFRASLQLWQLQGYSVSPYWQQSDLRFTRLTHSQRGEVLTFKQVTWQTLRIEADASENCDDAPTTPLRLLTNGGRLNLALKRRIKDCMVLSSKLSFFLDELLWVLTDSQLRALLSYTKSLSEAVQKSVRQRKQLGEPQVRVPSPTAPPPWSLSPPPSSSSSLGQYFEKFDVKETSYHLLISKLELHVCDESQTKGTVSGGAIQVTLRRINLDYYPTHKAGLSCAHWNRFSSAMGTCEQWIQELAQERQAKEDCEDSSMLGKMQSPKRGSAGSSTSSLYLRSVLIRVDDMDIHQVSSSGQSPQKPPLISCGHIPGACSAVHLQYTEYYRFPGDSLSVPPPALYIQLHGLLVYLAAQSVLWLNYFMLDLSHHLQQFAAVTSIVNEEAREHRDVRLDGFNLKLSFPVPPPSNSPPERPSSICAHLTSVTLTNTRQAPGSSIDLLQNTFRSFAAHEAFHYPPGPLHPAFLSHVYPSSEPPSTSLWSLHSPGLSLRFEGGVPKHQILLHPMPFTAWACILLSERQLLVMFSVDQMVRLQLNHYHYLTLLRLQEQVQALLEGLQKLAHSPSEMPSLCPTSISVGLLIPVVTISLMLPASHSLVQPEDSERSSLNGFELTDGDTGSEREKNKLILVNKNEVLAIPLGMEPQDEFVVQQGIPAQPDEQIKAEQVEVPVKDSPNKVVAQDSTQAKELSVDLFLGKDFARDTLLNTLGLTRENFSLGKERMQRLLGDTKHKDVDATHNQMSSPLSRTQSFDTVSLEGFDVLSLDSETTENFLLKLDAELAANVETALSDQDTTSQSTEGPEPHQILTLALHNVTSVTRVLGEDVSVTVQALDLSCAQKAEDLKGLVASIPGTPPASMSTPRVTLYFDLGPTAASFSPLAVRNGFLQLLIQDFCSTIPVSALTHLGPFLEDEKIPEILPMIIQVNNSKITLHDDGPRLYPSPISPEPVAFSLNNLKVQRKEDGVFCLIGEESPDPVSRDTHPSFVHISNSSEALPKSIEVLQQELLAARAKLEQQKQQEERLLQEIRKYNPLFNI
ncbi:PREDICTED: UHRF1-binding protein 1 [Nanorana parkeri]|uniref:UHRF1-binding protein 1 n=1 Tax=Nanorana parkeri TaxID=125878 RepID=UPI000854BAA3|nr:PREDICTED: UHRF1-binding protein 1 [Nanorana parkeri]